MGRRIKKFSYLGIPIPENVDVFDIFSRIRIDFNNDELDRIHKIKREKELKRCKKNVY